MFTSVFWKIALVRAVKTFAQTLVAILGTNAAGVLAVDWTVALSTSGLAGLMSILTSVSSVGIDVPASVAPAAPVVAPEPVAKPSEPVVAPITPAPSKPENAHTINIVVPEPAPAPDLSNGVNPANTVL